MEISNKKQPCCRRRFIMVVIFIALSIPLTAMIFAAQNYREYRNKRAEEALFKEKHKDAEMVGAKVHNLCVVLEKMMDQYRPLPLSTEFFSDSNLDYRNDSDFKFDLISP